MSSGKARLDRFISATTSIKRSDVRLLLAQKRVLIDGRVATCISEVIDSFARVELDGKILQEKQPVYIMLNKPAGVVSATQDTRHPTVTDLLDPSLRDDVHIVGRLDFNSSGLVLLTNNGAWSRQLTAPESKVIKVYEVTVEQPISDDCIQAFAEGMYFSYEDLITRPARLERLSDHVALVSLTEGRYHQIKRMFGRYRNKVLKLHRISIGNIHLDTSLHAGESRALNADEIRRANKNASAAHNNCN